MEGYDICYDCEESQEYGTMKDVDMFEFDIYCDDCLSPWGVIIMP